MQLDKLERVLHTPGQTRPSFALIYPILAFCCGSDADPALRQAGFIFLIAYLETPAEESSNLEQGSLFWHFIRSAHRNHLASDDWDQRLKALQLLISGGGRVEGLVDLIPTLCAWQVYAVEATTTIGGRESGPLLDAFSERIVLQRRGADIQRLILQICHKNFLTLTERDEECAVVAFLKALEVAVQESCHEGTGGCSDPPDPNSRLIQPCCSPIAQPIPWAFQATAFIKLLSVLYTNGPLPSEYVHPTIQSMFFILGSTATPLPHIGSTGGPVCQSNPASGGTVDIDSCMSELEYESLQLISDLLSNGYSTTIVYEIKQNLIINVNTDKPNSGEMKKARGAARALRLALRQGSQHRLVLSGDGELEDSRTHAAIGPSDLGVRFGHAVGVGPSWDLTHTRDITGKAVASWVAEVADRPSAEAEAIVLECIGVAKDIIAECAAADRNVTDDEAHIVGDILCEAVECLRMQYGTRFSSYVPGTETFPK